MKRSWLSALSIVSLCAALGASPACADENLEVSRDGVEYKAENFEVTLGGRLHLDAAQIDDTGTSIDDEEIHRARLELDVRFYDDWRLRIDREFARGGGWRNVWLSYDVNDDLTLKAGNFVAPFSMEDLGSSNETMFMERSLAQALSPGFGVGVAASYQAPHFAISGGYFGDALDADEGTQAEKGRGVALRGTWSPIEQRDQVLHFGLGLERRDLNSDALRRVASAPEAALAPTVVTSGSIPGIDTATSYNFEVAYSRGPVLLQGQYITTDLSRRVGGDISLSGYYVQAGWIINGERHRYSDRVGIFAGPRPRSDWGAVELAARVSSLDLSEGVSSRSGQADDYTFGVNWYVNRNIRLMGNFVHSEVETVDPLRNRDADVAEARFQINF